MQHVDNKVLWYRSLLSEFQSARPFSKCIFWQTTSKCLIFQINPTPRISSLIDYRTMENFLLGANFHDFCGQICFRKNKTAKKWTKMEIDDIILCVHRYELVYERVDSLWSVCPLNGQCRVESACYYMYIYKILNCAPVKISHYTVFAT